MGKAGRCLAYGTGEISYSESISDKNEPTLCGLTGIVMGKTLQRNIAEQILLEAKSL